jgi:gamma-glutamylcyclotransferase (GGCT)/AIG2-like uncharacterized protein YtfP
MMINLFVFGTLRQNLPLHRMYLNARPGDFTLAEATGTMFSYHDAYPVVDFDGDGTVVGEIYEVDTDDRYIQDLCNMEVSAGYTIRSITATPDDGDPVTCVAFHWGRGTRHLDPVPDGDWKEWDRTHAWNTSLFSRS